MPCDYVTLEGRSDVLDLDAVHDVVGGRSGKRAEWSALIVFDPKSSSFVELRSSPPDIRGGSADEAEAVTESYISTQFGLSASQLAALRSRPTDWTFIDRRTLANGS